MVSHFNILPISKRMVLNVNKTGNVRCTLTLRHYRETSIFSVETLECILCFFHNFRKERHIEYKMRVGSFYNFFLKNWILRRIQRRIIIHLHRSSCKEPVIVVILNKLGFSGQIFGQLSDCQFSENPSSRELSRFMRVAEMTKVMIYFRDFVI